MIAQLAKKDADQVGYARHKLRYGHLVSVGHELKSKEYELQDNQKLKPFDISATNIDSMPLEWPGTGGKQRIILQASI